MVNQISVKVSAPISGQSWISRLEVQIPAGAPIGFVLLPTH
jgi:hypothetical protein